jgi:hypothetical protein
VAAVRPPSGPQIFGIVLLVFVVALAALAVALRLGLP